MESIVNAERRKNLQQALTLLSTACGIVEDIHAQEEESYENLPDGMKAEDQGTKMEESVASLEGARDKIEEAASEIEAAME